MHHLDFLILRYKDEETTIYVLTYFKMLCLKLQTLNWIPVHSWRSACACVFTNETIQQIQYNTEWFNIINHIHSNVFRTLTFYEILLEILVSTVSVHPTLRSRDLNNIWQAAMKCDDLLTFQPPSSLLAGQIFILTYTHVQGHTSQHPLFGFPRHLQFTFTMNPHVLRDLSDLSRCTSFTT